MWKKAGTSGRGQSGHDPEPLEERGEGREEREVQQPGGPKVQKETG